MPFFAARTTIVALAAVIALVGCQSPSGGPTPTSAGIPPAELIDPTGYGDSPSLPVDRDIFRVGERIRAAQRPTKLPGRKTCLALSGGGAYGAYQAGLLVGWSEGGTRPAFDAVTGVSTGALVAVLAFLGPEFDGELRRVYTSLRTEDIYTRRRGVRSLWSDALADNAPLARQIDRVLTPEAVSRLAAEHQKGRRLYIGTTDLEGRRPVVWDLGAIAARGEPWCRDLIAKLLLASAAIPAFFPPVEVPVDVDGRRLVERHVDGGVTQNVFFRPPQVPPELRLRPPAEFLYGSDLYVIVAGKLFADAEVVRPRVLKIAAGSVSTLIYAETRAELTKLYMTAMVAGMNYHLAALPADFPAPSSSTEFDPSEMTRMFKEGRRQVLAGTAWRPGPPGTADGETLAQRAGTRLTRAPHEKPPAPVDR
ncbi:patatin-like phospholipase family protein [Gemmata sp. G18]|uniref:Patatin-like phospholipase family protein n=1 Tax=Gemmata palustris TaxID=2822762 RepID=A0ABS5BKU3_9BACT|nr:patatin-like phospholipase family protein [Gemmata palustris]MBP3954308.1 patatin-like phospholipase family protein [Gemmata palustris]